MSKDQIDRVFEVGKQVSAILHGHDSVVVHNVLMHLLAHSIAQDANGNLSIARRLLKEAVDPTLKLYIKGACETTRANLEQLEAWRNHLQGAKPS